MKDFFGRAPFVFLGALGLLSLPGTMIEWQSHVGWFIDGFNWLSHWLWWPWNWLIGELFNLIIAPWFQNFLTFYLIVMGSAYRAATNSDSQPFYMDTSWYGPLKHSFLWPLSFPSLYLRYFFRDIDLDGLSRTEITRRVPLYLKLASETFILTFLILAINYALLFGGIQ